MNTEFGGETSWKMVTKKTEKEMNFKEVSCEDGRWMELAQNHAHWWP
jgi:predicted phosphohydrolase